MAASSNLKRLIDAVAPLFAGEAEVFSTYWESPRRDRETDRLWILRQARKEVWDTPLGDPRGGLHLAPATRTPPGGGLVPIRVSPRAARGRRP